MQYALILPALLTVLVLAYMGFLVARNSSDLTNRVFLIFTLVDIAWILSVFLVIQTPLGEQDVLSRVAYASALTLTVVIQTFTYTLLNIRHGALYKALLYGVGAVVLVVTLVTPFVISGVDTTTDLPFPKYGALYVAFISYLMVAIGAFLFKLYKYWRRVKTSRDPFAKRQLGLVTFGLVVFVLISLATNLILPGILHSAWPAQFMPLASLVLAASLFYAMSRYRLFDIHTAVARGTAYVSLTTVLALAFVLTVSIVSTQVAAFENNENLGIVLNTVAALMLAVSFHPLKIIFDKVTNRIFFRDRYDTKEVLDSLNDILISHTDVREMLDMCESLLLDRLKLEACAIVIPGSGPALRVFGHQKDLLTHREYAALRDEVLSLDSRVVAASDLPAGSKILRTIFKEKQISAIGKMTLHKGDVGLIVLGAKKNGAPLSAQDIGILSITADQLAIATQNVLRFEEIRNFNETLQEKVDEATKKLRRTNDRLRVLDQTKDDFISMASHQLRTPLTAIKGYVSMTLEGDAGPLNETQQKMLNQAFISSQRMAYLISDLLDVSRVKTGKFVIEPVECNLTQVVEEELQQLAESAKSRNLMLTYHKPEHFPTLMLDETKLRQVIMNFVDNAIYYTPSGGRISVSLTENAHSVEFTVTDNGIGVPRHERHHLFTKFYRANNAKSARPDGTGLGLFMAKKVVIAQGGAIIFKSVENKGSTFGFTFPKAKLLPKSEINPQPKVASHA